MIKDIEYIFKKIFLSEEYLLKKRLKRAIAKNYEKELYIVDHFKDKSKDAIDVGVYRGVYSYKLSKEFNQIHSFEPNPLLYPYLNRYLTKIIPNMTLYNYFCTMVVDSATPREHRCLPHNQLYFYYSPPPLLLSRLFRNDLRSSPRIYCFPPCFATSGNKGGIQIELIIGQRPRERRSLNPVTTRTHNPAFRTRGCLEDSSSGNQLV